MNEFTDKLTDIVKAVAELAVIDDPKNPPCTVVLQSGLTTSGDPALVVKMWLPTEGQPGKLDAYELNSGATPEGYTELLDGARDSVRRMIRQRQGGLN